MAGNQNYYAGDNVSAAPSPGIWKDCPNSLIREKGASSDGGYFDHDEFTSFAAIPLPLVGATSSTTAFYAQSGFNAYKAFMTATNPTLVNSNVDVGGVIIGTTAANDNEEIYLEEGFGNGGPWKTSLTGIRGGPKLWFEARVSFGQIVTQDFFVGLAEKGLAAASGLYSNADALADKSLIGFSIQSLVSSSVINCIHQKNGGGGALTIGTAVASQTIVASTFIKLGFVVDMMNGDLKRLRYFVNGIEVQNTPLSSTAQQAAFPSAANLTRLFAMKNSAAAASSVKMDWWRCAQLAN